MDTELDQDLQLRLLGRDTDGGLAGGILLPDATQIFPSHRAGIALIGRRSDLIERKELTGHPAPPDHSRAPTQWEPAPGTSHPREL